MGVYQMFCSGTGSSIIRGPGIEWLTSVFILEESIDFNKN